MYREGVADLQLCVDDVDEAYIASAACLLISGTALCTSPTREASFKALTFALRCGVPVVFDADYRAYTWKNKDEIAIYTSMVAEKAATAFHSPRMSAMASAGVINAASTSSATPRMRQITRKFMAASLSSRKYRGAPR